MDDERPITLVSCCGPKLSERAPAELLYTSPLFRLSKDYATVRGRWYILSALYGLVEPSEEIEPYDLVLKSLPRRQRIDWGAKVVARLSELNCRDRRFVVLAGREYVDPLKAAGLEVDEPMKGLRFGLRLQWLKRQVEP